MSSAGSGQVLEATPAWRVSTLDDGKSDQPSVHLQVELPGVAESSEITFVIADPRHLVVHVPGRYRADITLGVPVELKAETVQWVRKKAVLRAMMRVQSKEAASAAEQQQQAQAPQQQPGATTADRSAAYEPHAVRAASTPPPQEHPAPGSAAAANASAAAVQGMDQAAPPAAGAASPREQLDAQMYAAAKQHSNREAAEECHARAQRALRLGEADRAVRLLQKACQLDPRNAAFAAVLREAQQRPAAGSASASAASSAGGAAGAGTRSSAASGGTPPAPTPPPQPQQRKPQREEPQRQQQQQQQRQQQQQQQQRQQQQPAEAEAAHEEGATAAHHGNTRTARRRMKKRARQWFRITAGGLASVAVLLAALWVLYRMAPDAASTAGAAGVPRSALRSIGAAMLFLPRVLLWSPSLAVAGLWAVAGGAACAALRTLDHAQRATGRPDVVPQDAYVVGLIAAWHPLLWWCCGGRWGALLGTAGEVLPVARLLGRSVWSHVALYPLACLALRLAATPLLPYWRIPAAPLLFVLRHTVWTPRWWLSGPASGGLCWAAMRAEARDAESFPLYLGALFLVAAWWLGGGGWWAVAHTAAQAAMYVVLVVSAGRYPAAYRLLGRHALYTPVPLFLAKAAWSLLMGPFSMWALLVGCCAGVLLYLHLSSTIPGPPPAWRPGYAGRQRGTAAGDGDGSGGGAAPTRHLHNTVPAGAPDAVARILQAGNYYEVLGLDQEADEAAIKRAKRTLSLATHPDKIGAAPGAADAFNLVTEACDVLGEGASRQQYDRELQDAALSSGFNLSPEEMEAAGLPPDWLDRMQEFAKACEAGDIPQHCSCCGSIHFMRFTGRPMAAARRCDECGVMHPVRQNEVWFESEAAGFMRRTIHMFCCYKGVVYDMSESATCDGTLQTVHERRFPLNNHVNFFKGFGLSTGGGGGGGGGGKKGKGGSAGRSQAPPRGQGPRGASSKKKGRRR
ncbi:dnaJ-like protein dnj-5 isoform X3 [Micractinium conductrix]|uniref:DnaJ-like protein dnj-5 isoform X3 n=1 Tax=Micractinium conductrix TaxID=554055 RepID=A0A2P6VP21_9CHLO|nr:dnaJ-like protein dnj-5 isoform X3 [Micractinium conductrix]|eukprot:PSC75844.1 dnaJ-like protein dnj-5 isoform X3 [Micractinium conductrix]